MASVNERMAGLKASPVIATVNKAWKGRFGGLLKGVVGFAGLLLAIEVLLRNNAPTKGTIVFGAIVGLLYAMVAFGLILIYRANRIINFAQAEMGATSAVLAVLLIKVHHLPYLLALPVALVTALISGFLIEVLVVRRFFKAPRLILSVATIGVALIFGIIQFFLPHWIAHRVIVDPKPPKTPFSALHFYIPTVNFDGNSIFILFSVILIVVALTAFFKYTDVGLAVRASAENADRATLLGISVKRLSTYVWMLATVLSAVGVFLRVPVIGLPIGADIGPFVLLYALSAAVIARMESFTVALAAGVGIGILEQSLYYFSRDPSIASAFMLPILLVAMLAQRGKLSRGQDTGLNSFKQATEFRPVPPELRDVSEVVWGKAVLTVLVGALLIGLPYMVSIGRQILISIVVIYAIVTVSLVILTGWAGQISLGQWGFAGIGALTAGGLASHMHTDFFVTIIAAGLAGAVASLIIGLPALRIQGLYLAVTTLAFAIVVQVYLLSPKYFSSILPNNAQAIVRPLIYGRFSIDGPRAFYYVCLIALGLTLASARALRRSRAGRVIVAARDNERGAQSYGISVSRARLAAFAISGFWAAVAGALFAYNQQAIDNNAFDVSVSLLMLIIVVIGGVTSLPGAILGSAWIGVLRFGGLSAQYQALASGVGVLLLLLVLPGGLAQAMYSARDGFLRAVAQRHKIVVPSLVADVRTEANEIDEAELLEAAPALNVPPEFGIGAGETAPAAAISCPTCGEAVLVTEVTGHEHFQVVTA